MFRLRQNLFERLIRSWLFQFILTIQTIRLIRMTLLQQFQILVNYCKMGRVLNFKLNCHSRPDRESMSKILKKFNENFPKFPDGRINYCGQKEAAVINVFIIFKNELLILKRSDKVGNYKERWNVVVGYYDELKAVEEKALGEVGEETGIGRDQIRDVKICPNFKLDDKEIDKIFYVFPVLITLKYKLEIKLDWEHTEYSWIKFDELKNYDIVYGLEKIFLKSLTSNFEKIP